MSIPSHSLSREPSSVVPPLSHVLRSLILCMKYCMAKYDISLWQNYETYFVAK